MILITGASAGIGEATARIFAENGNDLVLLARRKDRLDLLADELREKHGIQAHSFAIDVRQFEEIDHFVKNHADLLSRVSALVNNAGLAKGAELIQYGDVYDWDVTIDTNIKGLLAMTRAMLPFFLK